MAPEPKHASEPDPAPAPCMYKAPPTKAKFPACRPLDAPHNWPPQEGDPRHQPPLLCMVSRGRTTGPIGQTTGTSAGCPTRLPAGIHLRMPTASTRRTPPTNALRHTACVTPATRAGPRRRCPRCQKGNSGPHLSSSWMHAYASPRCVCPAPCVAWRCRAADYACCISMTTTASAAACLAQILRAPMMQSAVSTWSTRPRTRMTGVAAAVVSRTPRMHRTHSTTFCIGPTAWTCVLHHPLPGLVQAFALQLNSKREKSDLRWAS